MFSGWKVLTCSGLPLEGRLNGPEVSITSTEPSGCGRRSWKWTWVSGGGAPGWVLATTIPFPLIERICPVAGTLRDPRDRARRPEPQRVARRAGPRAQWVLRMFVAVHQGYLPEIQLHRGVIG